MKTHTKIGLASIAALTVAGAASAHTGGNLAGVGAGLLHPLVGLDHLIAMFAVGLWASLAPAKKAIQGPLAFLAALVVGFGLGLGGASASFIETGIIVSLIALGGLMLLRHKVPMAMALALIGGFGLFHGHAHGAEATGAVGGYMVGFLATSIALHLLGYAVGSIVSRNKYAVPAMGASVAAVGLILASA
ncbi:HupE/UreJ family protein [Kordiimonas lipolytica]|uniref:HupE/UreJ family protein n=1 Tax=Kordiimonas lipolytica TaxID=1662421 RepID=A0ABV8UBN5_9PROT|nr:HupE/UreJ family protein [Kordiimonas lipolytica]